MNVKNCSLETRGGDSLVGVKWAFTGEGQLVGVMKYSEWLVQVLQ